MYASFAGHWGRSHQSVGSHQLSLTLDWCRTLDIVHYKASAPDRKRDLLPIEADLWSILEPFLARVRPVQPRTKAHNSKRTALPLHAAAAAPPLLTLSVADPQLCGGAD